MRRCILIIAVLYSLRAQGQRYIFTDKESSVKFTIANHLITNTTVNGSFTGLKGIAVFDPGTVEKSSVEASVDVNTISTGISLRNHDLKQEKYFYAEKFPVINIRSARIEKTGQNGNYILNGVLTIKGITKTVIIPFTASPEGNGYRFRSRFKLNRLDYDVGKTGKIDNELTVEINAYAKKS
jgi:polyisoprenoid-binding protein YceI